MTGALLGGACGLIMAAVALAWLRQGQVAVALLAGIGIGIAGSAAFGLALPYARLRSTAVTVSIA